MMILLFSPFFYPLSFGIIIELVVMELTENLTMFLVIFASLDIWYNCIYKMLHRVSSDHHLLLVILSENNLARRGSLKSIKEDIRELYMTSS